jgi:hypothetical protein
MHGLDFLDLDWIGNSTLLVGLYFIYEMYGPRYVNSSFVGLAVKNSFSRACFLTRPSDFGASGCQRLAVQNIQLAFKLPSNGIEFQFLENQAVAW